VQCINHACDLAILSVKDKAFWAHLKPLTISPTIPHLFENVVVVGFPMVQLLDVFLLRVNAYFSGHRAATMCA
jgi:hypothetical protein